jgi:hypothetical protein
MHPVVRVKPVRLEETISIFCYHQKNLYQIAVSEKSKQNKE